ncbi:hypothetical protein GGI04_003508 [Coemansia thaxteri]|uniref:RRM domain-containing protein n=1 Tax=Coemansia thaxteri TaxID=2663907 RepID=A0A9W8EE72_9FUNG|nr:hypothetical protein H4R26_004250 [Coemansia thaxteri]KAJ2002032.1 hypothetical protein GGI04_003508 [Coemansia thaxteri]KAJ2466941.1 hypothetical protein GGI02_004202 [Coemansia sp. RSA 2322]
MTSRLPPDLLQLFTPRPPLAYVEPVSRAPTDRPRPAVSGIAQYASELLNAAPGSPVENPRQRRERIKKEHAVHARDAIIRGLSTWDPSLNLNATEDPYKTIIVARLNYDTTEKDLRAEFSVYGDIASVKMVNDLDGNFRGYAFIEFVHEADMREAFRRADAMRILGRRIVVDVERGRTVKGWLPRRFAGGLGGSRIGGKDQNQREPGRFDPAMPPEPVRRYAEKPRDRQERPARERDPSRSRSRYDSRNRDHDRDRSHAYDRDRERDRDRDRPDRRDRHRSRSPSLRSSRRDRSHDRSSSHYSRRH